MFSGTGNDTGMSCSITAEVLLEMSTTKTKYNTFAFTKAVCIGDINDSIKNNAHLQHKCSHNPSQDKKI
jgi:hypothetical protein